ncbi:MAG TPA: amidase [Candidatus Polarisedimenticolia bacterium]|jgi:amidase|nr:amidase [Candidatus Polarisedimenticolia bacterium]
MGDRTMGRRKFLECAAVGGAIAAAIPALKTAARPQTESAGDLEEATIAELQEGMSSGRYTARALTESYLRRIDRLDRRGPELRSVLEVNPDAIPTAEKLDAERKAKGPRGPLHGIPLLLKDNVCTRDRMQSTAGSLALVGVKPPRDAAIVERLRSAGAVILGKTNLSEWANFRSIHSSSGWSARGGQCRNPYALDRTPSGSSSGSGVAVAAGLCAAAVGTETDGSIVSPSNCCSLVGIKPTLGLVSRTGIIPIAHSQDTAGPMARTVADAAALLGALAGVDARDGATAANPQPAGIDYAARLDPRGLQGARLGVCRAHYMGYSPATDALMERALEALKRLGATLIDPADIATAGSFDESEYMVLLYEFKADLNKHLARWAPGGSVRTLKDLIAFNERRKDEELRYFGQEILVEAQAKGSLTQQEYLRALDKDKLLSRLQGIDAVMGEHRLDALVAPTGSPPSLIDLVNGDPSGGGSFSSPAAVAGYPHVTVPMGYVAGLPVGLSFVGRPWSEETLIRFAYAYEQATKARRPPQFLPSADLRGGRG